MFKLLNEINSRPKPFEFYTVADLWTDEHTSKRMLECHLNEEIDMSSRNIKFIERSVEWIAAHFSINEDTEIIDFGCGPGLYTTRLAEKKASVTGVDFSERSLQYAREIAEQKDLNINYVNQNYLEFETDKKFDLITMIMCDFCALGPDQRKQLVNKFYSILKPGGSVLLDVYSLNAYNQREEAASYELNSLNSFWSPEKYYGFLNTFKYDKEKVILDKYTIIEEVHARIIYNWLQYFDEESLKNEFLEAGFTIEGLYSDVAGALYNPESSEMAIVAIK